MKSFHIVTNPHRDGAGNHMIGTVRQLPNEKWVWHGLGRSSKKQLPNEEAAQKAAKRAFGNVRFEEVLQ